jgi:hypothetical protein
VRGGNKRRSKRLPLTLAVSPLKSGEWEPAYFPSADLRNWATSSRTLLASTPDCFSSSS